MSERHGALRLCFVFPRDDASLAIEAVIFGRDSRALRSFIVTPSLRQPWQQVFIVTACGCGYLLLIPLSLPLFVLAECVIKCSRRLYFHLAVSGRMASGVDCPPPRASPTPSGVGAGYGCGDRLLRTLGTLPAQREENW